MYNDVSPDRLYSQLLHDPSLDELDRKILSVYVKLPKEYQNVLKKHVLQVTETLAQMPNPGGQLSFEDQTDANQAKWAEKRA